MKIEFSPQRNDDHIEYSYGPGDSITAAYKKLEGEEVVETLTETFDFNGLPDGILTEVTTDLPVNPVITAKKENGVLTVTLLTFHGPNASHEELFPEPKEV